MLTPREAEAWVKFVRKRLSQARSDEAQEKLHGSASVAYWEARLNDPLEIVDEADHSWRLRQEKSALPFRDSVPNGLGSSKRESATPEEISEGLSALIRRAGH